MMRYARRLPALFACLMAVSACASLDVNKLPAPGNSFPGGYPIVMEFANVLNLPARAKVTLDGILVGIVTDVRAAGGHVDVTSRIDPSVRVPSNIHAALQQATILGDIHVALSHPSDSAAGVALAPGSTLPLAQTTSPPQLEDTISHLADFIGSGSLQRMQDAIIGLNRITPPSEDVRRMSSQFSADIGDLGNNIDTVDHLLNGASQTAQALHNRIPELTDELSPNGIRGWDRAMGIGRYISKAVPSVGSIYSGGFWLVPFFNSLANATGAIQQSKWAFEREVPAWRTLFTDYFLPQDKYPAINITSIVGPDGRELSGNVHDVLRLLGALP